MNHQSVATSSSEVTVGSSSSTLQHHVERTRSDGDEFPIEVMNGSSSSILRDHVERSDGDELVQVDSNIGMSLRKSYGYHFMCI